MEALKPNFASQFGNSGIPPEVIRCAKNLLTSDVAKEMAVTAKRLIPPQKMIPHMFRPCNIAG